jgi:hypothetical protein
MAQKLALFIDTNIYLSFYELSQANVEHLNALSNEILAKKITYCLTQQVKEEFLRERPKNIKRFLKGFQSLSFPGVISCLIKNFDTEFQQFKQSQIAYEKAHSILLNKVTEAAINNNLEVDKIITPIFENATFLDTTEDIINASQLRVQQGNPPGKNLIDIYPIFQLIRILGNLL